MGPVMWRLEKRLYPVIMMCRWMAGAEAASYNPTTMSRSVVSLLTLVLLLCALLPIDASGWPVDPLSESAYAEVTGHAGNSGESNESDDSSSEEAEDDGVISPVSIFGGACATYFKATTPVHTSALLVSCLFHPPTLDR